MTDLTRLNLSNPCEETRITTWKVNWNKVWSLIPSKPNIGGWNWKKKLNTKKTKTVLKLFLFLFLRTKVYNALLFTTTMKYQGVLVYY
jgi:hypothetical protein